MKNKTKRLYICRGHATCKANDKRPCPHAKPHKWVHASDEYLGCHGRRFGEDRCCDCIKTTKLKVMLEKL